MLAARRQNAAASARIEDLVPLGAVLTDLERFAEADAIYQGAFHAYDGFSPFPLAWVCFQLGLLWGELVPKPNLNRAAAWYERAIAYLPAYAKARVHLAEVYLARAGRPTPRRCFCRRFQPAIPRSIGGLPRCCEPKAGSRKPRHSSTLHDAASTGFSRSIRSPSRTMRQSSMPAAAMIAGERSSSRARM